MSRLSLAVVCAIFAAGAPSFAAAHDFCVTSSAELRVALAAASNGGANQDEINHINMAAGTYATSDVGDRFFYINTSATSGLHLWGGFNSDCTSMAEDASMTVLDGVAETQVLVARSLLGDVDLLNFTAQNADTTQPGAGIAVNDTGSTTGDVFLRNLILRNNHTSSTYGGLRAFVRGTHVLYFDNNVVVGNSADQGYSAGQLVGAAQVYARYDTVAYNTSISANGGALFCIGTACEIANDIFWHNDTVDLYLVDEGNLYFDDIGVLQGTVPTTTQGVVATDPLFVDAATGDFHLGDGSPLIGVSTYYASQSDNDVEGHALPLTGRTDMGGYIETVFHDVFE
ncbi:MAG: hypothetical protein ABJB01_08220 [Rudaea sp.]